MSVTLKEVANKCGVSITAVSLVLNNKPNRISIDVQKRILDTVKKMNYKPNQIAVSMITKKTKTIGLILPDISNLYFSELAKVIEQNAYLAGYNIIYGNTSDSVEHTFEYFEFFSNRGVDGIIMIYSNLFVNQHKKKMKQIIEKIEIPVVVLDRFLVSNLTTTILVNHKKGGEMATKHLIDLGHRKIGCVTGPINTISSNERLEGYKRALRTAGLPFKKELVFQGDFQAQSGMEALPYLLKEKVTAIFSFNDMMAIGLYRECKKSNIEIPNDLSIVGYDDIFLSELLDPPLTTIFQPINELGMLATSAIIGMINNNTKDVEKIVLDPVLKIRESTKKVNK